MNLTLFLPESSFDLISALTAAVTTAPAQHVSLDGVSPVVAMATEPDIVLVSEEGVAPAQNANPTLSSSI